MLASQALLLFRDKMAAGRRQTLTMMMMVMMTMTMMMMMMMVVALCPQRG